MSDLISRSALKKYMRDYKWEFALNSDFSKAMEMVDVQPTIEAVEVKHGEWIKEEPDEHGNRKPKCLVCGEYHLTSWSDYARCKFCPECGADMRKGGAE